MEQLGFFTAALYQIIDSEVAAFSFAQIIDDFRRSNLAPNFTGHYGLTTGWPGPPFISLREPRKNIVASGRCLIFYI